MLQPTEHVEAPLLIEAAKVPGVVPGVYVNLRLARFQGGAVFRSAACGLSPVPDGEALTGKCDLAHFADGERLAIGADDNDRFRVRPADGSLKNVIPIRRGHSDGLAGAIHEHELDSELIPDRLHQR